MIPVLSRTWADEKVDTLVASGYTEQDAKRAVAAMRRFVPTQLPPLRAAGGPGSGRYPKGSGGQTSSPEFRAWFGKSKVVNPDGTPQVLYHGTNSDPSDFHVGTHFGTVEAANERADMLSDFSTDVVHRDPGRFQVMPVYLSIQHPLRLPDLASLDDNTGESMDDAQAAYVRKYPDDEERAQREEEGTGDAPRARAWEDEGSGSGLVTTLYERKVIERDEFWDHQYDTNEEIFKLLEEKGYDGIVYNNAVEHAGHDSWIIFHPEQVKSAIGNSGAFSKTTKLITGGGPGSGRYPKGSGGQSHIARTPGDIDLGDPSGSPEWMAMRKAGAVVNQLNEKGIADGTFAKDSSTYDRANASPEYKKALETWETAMKAFYQKEREDKQREITDRVKAKLEASRKETEGYDAAKKLMEDEAGKFNELVARQAFTTPEEWAAARKPSDDAREAYNTIVKVWQQRQEAAEAEAAAKRVQVGEDHAVTIAAAMGVDPSVIHVVDKDPREFAVGGQQFREGGHFNPETGQIEINVREASPSYVPGMIAHESSHLIYDTVNNVKDREREEIEALSPEEKKRLFVTGDWGEGEIFIHGARPEMAAELRDRYPASAAFAETWGGGPLQPYEKDVAYNERDANRNRMIEENGHSAYAKAYWAKEALRGSYMTAVNETLAEVTRYLVSPRSWKESGAPEPKSLWVKLAKDLQAAYATIRSRTVGRDYSKPLWQPKAAAGFDEAQHPRNKDGEFAASDAADELITGRLTDDLDNVSGDEHTPADIQKVLDHYGAEPLKMRGDTVPGIFVTDTHVIEWGENDEWPTYAEKADWINNADLDTYFPDYEDQLNTDFWSGPGEVYHATQDENADEILRDGLNATNQTRGISNRNEGPAVYTTTDLEETAMGSYGDTVFAIDTGAMAKDGYKPYTSQEPDVVESELRRSLAHAIGLDDYEYDEEQGMSPNTIAIHGHIPAKYLKRMDS